MTLDEAIKHAEEVAEQSEEDAKAWIREGWQSVFKNLNPEKEAEFFAERVKLSDGCAKCAEEHRQLAEWLKELKELREQKRPHGEWIKMRDKEYQFDFCTCSVCGDTHKLLMNYFLKSNFCPNCGARMISSNSEIENPCKTCTKYIGNMCEHVCEKRYEYIKVGNTIYTQDDDKQGWTGKEGE